MLQALSSFLKLHKRKVLFVSIAAAVGYASYQAYATLNAEIDAMKKRLASQAGQGPLEDGEARREQVFVQAQFASDGALLSFLGTMERRLNDLVPRVSAAQLKEQMAQCASTEEKMALIQAKATSELLHTGMALYALAALAVALKTTYAVAAAAMSEPDNDATAVATAAEDTSTRITQRLLGSEEGLSALMKRVENALDQCLAAVPVRQPCSYSAFCDLWRNVRCKVEDLSFDTDPALIFAPGEAVRRSLLRHVFPFAADGVAAGQPFAARVDAVLSAEDTLDVLNNVTQQLFALYFERVQDKFDPAHALPLIRVVPLVQSESSVILGSENPFVEGLIRNDVLRGYLKNAAGVEADLEVKKVLFVCARNDKESVVASMLARRHASMSARSMLDVFSAAETLAVPDEAQVEEGVLELLGGDYYRPQGLASIPRNVTFDAVVLFGNARPESAIASRQTLVWPTMEGSEETAGLETRVKQLLDSL